MKNLIEREQSSEMNVRMKFKKYYHVPMTTILLFSMQTHVMAASGTTTISVDKDTEIDENFSRKNYNVWDEEENEDF